MAPSRRPKVAGLNPALARAARKAATVAGEAGSGPWVVLEAVKISQSAR